MRTTFDIETIAKPLAELEALIPAFDPESVKTGNYGKEAAAKKIEEARTAHREEFIKKAALNPIASTCKMVGFLTQGEKTTIYAQADNIEVARALRDHGAKQAVVVHISASEQIMLNRVIAEIVDLVNCQEHIFATYYGKTFDLPFLYRRAWLNGVAANPRTLKRGRYFRDNIVDLYDEWGMGERFPATGGLKGLAKMLKCPSQKEGNGEMFGDLYAKDPCAALDYLINDLRVTDECAERMGVV